MESKRNSENDAILKQLKSENLLLKLILIQFKKMKGIPEHIPVKDYQSFVANNNIKLKYQRLFFL